MKQQKARSKGVGGAPISRRTFILVGVVGAGLAWAIDRAWNTLHPDGSIESLEDPLFIDSVNGETFHMKLELGMTFPVVNPSTGQATGYPAELCYWTKDGTVKDDPTAVLLHSYIGKPEPTFCPDCDRLVVPHNPMARPGMRPPPTEPEYWADHPRPAGWSE